MSDDHRALRMWRLGFSYEQIAECFGLRTPEGKVNAGAVERLVSEARSEELKRPSPYRKTLDLPRSA